MAEVLVRDQILQGVSNSVVADVDKELKFFMTRWNKHPVSTGIYFMDDFVAANRNYYARKLNEPLTPSLLDLKTQPDGTVYSPESGTFTSSPIDQIPQTIEK